MGYELVLNTHQAAAGKGQGFYQQSNENQDIGLSAVAQDQTPGAVAWLTMTPLDRAAASIARYEPTGGAEQYPVGWVETGSANVFKLALLEASLGARAVRLQASNWDDLVPFGQAVGRLRSATSSVHARSGNL